MSDEITDAQFEKLKELHRNLKQAVDFKRFHRISFFKPYAKQLAFIHMGATKNQRMFSAGNRLGKSETGAFEMACHLTGDYPAWWTGRRYTRPIKGWAAGRSARETRDISQDKLCGPPNVAEGLGTGYIPLSEFAQKPTLGRGITGAYDMIQVTHRTNGVVDGVSQLWFKSYEQGWETFQGTSIDQIWLDEEPEDLKIYSECVTRVLDVSGGVFVTFTPLHGETELYIAFHGGRDKAKAFITMTGDEVLDEANSHLKRDEYEEWIAGIPAFQRAARRNGTPVYGVGSVFEFPREQISFTMPHPSQFPGWARFGWGVDFGGPGKYSHPFGAVLGMYDPLTDVIYVIATVRTQGQTAVLNAYQMKQIAAAAPVAWPHDGVRQAGEPQSTQELYRSAGLRMWHHWATHGAGESGGYATETGILDMHQRFATGRLKIANHLTEWWEEYVNYHREETGAINRNKDDLMSATRILVMMCKKIAQQVPLGNLGGTDWKSFARKQSGGPGSNLMSTGLARDIDPWDSGD